MPTLLAHPKPPSLFWERRWEWPLTVLAVAFLIAYAWPILQPALDSRVKESLAVVTWLVWGVFLVDYLARWHLSTDRRGFVRTSLPDLLVIVLPLLRPLRVLRLVTLLDVLNRRVAGSLRGRVLIYVVGSSCLVILCSALAVLDAERRSPDANIRTFGDAVWWAATTVTTVGMGTVTPPQPRAGLWRHCSCWEASPCSAS